MNRPSGFPSNDSPGFSDWQMMGCFDTKPSFPARRIAMAAS